MSNTSVALDNLVKAIYAYRSIDYLSDNHMLMRQPIELSPDTFSINGTKRKQSIISRNPFSPRSTERRTLSLTHRYSQKCRFLALQ